MAETHTATIHVKYGKVTSISYKTLPLPAHLVGTVTEDYEAMGLPDGEYYHFFKR